MKVFVVRAKPHGVDRESQFLSGIISIGWPTSESLANKNRVELAKILRDKFNDDMSEIAITMVQSFIDIPVGSIVLTPSYQSSNIHVFQTTSTYRYVAEWSDDDVGNPHVIEAKYLRTVSRQQFSIIVQKALKSAKRTVSNFSKYSNEILDVAFESFDTIDLEKNQSSKGLQEAYEGNDELEARQTLKELLKSDNDEVRLKAALALLNK